LTTLEQLTPNLGRKSKSGDDSLATKLLQQQHAMQLPLRMPFTGKLRLCHLQSFVITACIILSIFCFISNYIVQAEGEFLAYKMLRTLVSNPLSYVRLSVAKQIHNGITYNGIISKYSDHKQWWTVQFEDMDVEDWAVSEMMKWVPFLFCGAMIDGVTEFSANTVRLKKRSRRCTVEGMASSSSCYCHCLMLQFSLRVLNFILKLIPSFTNGSDPICPITQEISTLLHIFLCWVASCVF
jgi:hypothetical protein